TLRAGPHEVATGTVSLADQVGLGMAKASGSGNSHSRFAVPISEHLMCDATPSVIARCSARPTLAASRYPVAWSRACTGRGTGRSVPARNAPAAGMPQLIWPRLSKPRRRCHGPDQPYALWRAVIRLGLIAASVAAS